jgi:DNA invertase Pin-like site-specific DNA recombinase
MTSSKIQNTHCERMAFVYVRQSTWLRVKENQESTERQYNLRERAIELGWPASRVEVIDEDQGRSGSTADYRTGFQRLAAEVGSGNVGSC